MESHGDYNTLDCSTVLRYYWSEAIISSIVESLLVIGTLVHKMYTNRLKVGVSIEFLFVITQTSNFLLNSS